MAKKRTAATSESIDWYLISVDRLKQIGLVVLILLLGTAGYWFYQKEKGNPRSNAEAAIADARQALNALAASKDFAQRRGAFDRAQKKLEEATSLFAAARFVEAQGAAVESQTISRTAMSGSADAESDAQFLTVEGDVQFQRASTSDWKRADPRTPLFNGDWVKTGGKASAELIFSNGSIYTVGPNALLEIYAQFNAGSARKTNAVQMQVGTVEVATTDDASSVRTPGSQVVVESESTTHVGVDPAKTTQVVTMKGSTSVIPATGGPGVKLASGQKISATAAGSLSEVRKLVLPPALLSPADNQVFQLAPDSRIDFIWDAQQGASAYQLQVSRSRLFTTLEINSRRTKTSAAARVSSEGTFYWRVASVGPDGEIGPPSQFRRFRVSGGGRGPSAPSADTMPPVLTLKAPFGIGGQFYIIEGTTEPGSTVFINDEEVDVESNGHFKKLVSFNKTGRNAVIVKAVDPAGNQTVQSQTVLVEE
ncbi:MAG TPA: hypothetical protein VNL91_01190 [Thermoanaerobaculia bacterium]|nr:hypothetical protein [Thermoanaerobaculia bacterium]